MSDELPDSERRAGLLPVHGFVLAAGLRAATPVLRR